MVISENKNKQENMVNNEQENYTAENPEENTSWFAKNKAMVIGGGLLLVVMAMWAFSGSNKTEGEASQKNNTSTGMFTNFWNSLDANATKKYVLLTVGGLIVLGAIEYAWGPLRLIGSKIKSAFDAGKNKVTGAGKEVPTN